VGLLAVLAVLLFVVPFLSTNADGATAPAGVRSVDETPSPPAAVPIRLPSPRPSTADPRSVGVAAARIASFDCERLTVRLTLDNSRSPEGVTFRYTQSFQSPLHPPYSGEEGAKEVDVAAGESAVVVLAVREDARTIVTVHLPHGGDAVGQGTCGAAPGAVFTTRDCGALRLGLRLDNSSSPRATRYRWTQRDPAGQVASRSLEVAARRVADVDVPLIDGSSVWVAVAVGDRALVVNSARYTCGRVVLNPRASFGVLECADVSAPVLLDNSRTTARLRFHVPAHPDVVLGAGETLTLRLHLPLAERLRVYADEVVAGNGPIDLAVVSTARCAGATGDPRTTPAAGAASDVSAGRADVVDADPAAAGSAPLLPVIGVAALLLAVALVRFGGVGTGPILRRSR
jgi:hypothetical protein